MLPQQRRATSDSPAALGQLIRRSRVDHFPTQLRMLHLDLHPAIDKVRVLQRFLGTMDHANLEAEVLRLGEKLVGGQL